MDFLSPGWRRTGALAFGAAVPTVLLGSILVIGHASANVHGGDDVLPPTPTQSTAPIVVKRQSGPPVVSDFQTDSTSGYLNGCRRTTATTASRYCKLPTQAPSR